MKDEGSEIAAPEQVDDEVFSSFYSIDAYNFGNVRSSLLLDAISAADIASFAQWTRFANHVCDGFNVVPRPVYVDEGDVTRPLWVYFASRDILVRRPSHGVCVLADFRLQQPGEEINISYFGESEPNPQDFGMTDAEWIAAANKQRDEAPPAHRCYCAFALSCSFGRLSTLTSVPCFRFQATSVSVAVACSISQGRCSGTSATEGSERTLPPFPFAPLPSPPA